MKNFLAKNRWAPLLVVIIVGLLYFSWDAGALRRYYRWIYQEVPIYGAASERMIVIQSACQLLPVGVQKTIISVEIAEELPWLFFLPSERRLYRQDTLAFCSGGRIFIKPDAVNKAAVFHEATHVYSRTLPPAFANEWLTVAGGALVYGPSGQKTRMCHVALPRDGILKCNGATGADEDLADYGEEAFSYLADPPHYQGALLQINNKWLHNSDLRYRQKIDLMYRWQFFTDEQYQRLVVAFF